MISPNPHVSGHNQQLWSQSISPAIADQGKKLDNYANRDHFVWFYDNKNALTYFLGNFHEKPVTIWGMTFKCSEGAFQAAKFSHSHQIMSQFCQLDGDAAWREAKKYAIPQNWGSQRDGVMEQVLYAKFSQNPELSYLLKMTGDAYLVEHCPIGRDQHWADNGDGTGENMLGKLLMKVRQQLGGTGIVNPSASYIQFTQSQPASINQRVAKCALPYCHKPRYVEANGKVYDFCGQKHAKEFSEKYKWCKFCTTVPGFVDPTTSKVHDYCCKSHAEAYYKQHRHY